MNNLKTIYCNYCGKIFEHYSSSNLTQCPYCNSKGYIPRIPRKVDIEILKVDIQNKKVDIELT